MRNALIVIVAVSAALVAGVAASAQFYRAQINTHMAELQQARQRAAVLEDEAKRAAPELESVRARVVRLEEEYATCAAQSDALRSEVDQLRASATAAPTDSGPDMDTFLDETSFEEEAPKPKKEAKQAARDNQEEPVEQAARQERMAEFRQMADDFFADAIANAPNEDSRARLETMDAYRRELGELREAMRAAKTDEERAELEAQADATREALQQVTREEQRAVLQEVGRSYGIKGADLQTFQRDLRNVMESPIFRFGGGGGGRGPGGRGFGGR